jgi:type IV fimbrial biogenesis protein FimT
VVNIRSLMRTAAKGFTALELLVVVAILSILLSVSAGGMSEIVAGQQLKTATFALHSTLNMARSEALTRNASVTVDPVGGDWRLGWTVTESGGGILERHSTYPRILLTGPARVIFSGDGRPDTSGTSFNVGASDVSESNYRCVRLRLNGRPAIDKRAC